MSKLKGAIFDLDGVVTKTAAIHFKAWKKLFDTFLKSYSGNQKTDNTSFKIEPFTHEDYILYVDGKPRIEGITSFLSSRRIDLPEGTENDSKDKITIHGLSNQKNSMFKEILFTDGVEIYQSTIDLIKEMKKTGFRTAIASSSKNCRLVLEKTGLLDLFDTVVDGIVSKELNLRGKPYPDIFIQAAQNLDLSHDECIMVEDSISGVQSGKNGNFAIVLGVSRNHDIQLLIENGADIAVEDISEISLQTITSYYESRFESDNWKLVYKNFEPENELLRETLTCTGNGYFGTRGCFAGSKALRETHYPGTYIAGVYNKLPTVVHGRTIFNNDLVNCPNWLLVELIIDNKDIVDPFNEEIISYTHELDMRKAVVYRSILFKDSQARITKIETFMFASMAQSHYGALRYRITPCNYSSSVTLRSWLDGSVVNDGVPRYRNLNSRHLETINKKTLPDGSVFLHTKTSQSHINIFMKAVHSFAENNTEIKCIEEKNAAACSFTFRAEAEKVYTIDKLVSIHASKNEEHNLCSPQGTYEQLENEHIKKWSEIWKKADIIIEGDQLSQKILRLHIYHLFTTASQHNLSLDAGMTARGLSGEAYRGHIFWDELFIFPFFNLHSPEITKSLLLYRYRRLDKAREYAAVNGCKGAMYPWQTADTGDEETQEVHYNPVSGKWDPDLSRNQRHVSIAIAYNILEYFKVTSDTDFIFDHGAEMLIEIARMWVSMAKKEKGKYHISAVMGPDEFHESYHGSKITGLKDNAYTNIMVSWLLKKTSEIIESLPEEILKRLDNKINFNKSELPLWSNVSHNLSVNITKQEIIEQFDGYMNLKELNWETYRKKYGDIHRLDRILKSENDSPDRYKVSKQADVLMLFYLLPPDQVCEILSSLGFDISDPLNLLKNNYDYYVQRTSHGSTLSHVVHSAILRYLPDQKENMYQKFISALKSDLYDTQGGTTREGIHTGVMGGTVNMVICSFAGINRYNEYLEIAPVIPDNWELIHFNIFHKGIIFNIKVTRNRIFIKQLQEKEMEFGIEVNGRLFHSKGKEVLEIKYPQTEYAHRVES